MTVSLFGLLWLLVSYGTTSKPGAEKTLTLHNVHKLRCVRVRRQNKSVAPHSVANHGHTSALELLVVRVPPLYDSTFGLNAGSWLERVKLVDLALVLRRLLPLHLALSSKAGME